MCVWERDKSCSRAEVNLKERIIILKKHINNFKCPCERVWERDSESLRLVLLVVTFFFFFTYYRWTKLYKKEVSKFELINLPGFTYYGAWSASHGWDCYGIQEVSWEKKSKLGGKFDNLCSQINIVRSWFAIIYHLHVISRVLLLLLTLSLLG